MEVGRTIMLQNAMMQMPTQTWQDCIIQWLQHKAQVRRLRTRTRSHWIAKYILWATPSAAGPRSLLIASGLQILDIVASGSLHFLGRKPVIWHDWWLHFGVLGTLGRCQDTGEHNKGHFEVQTWIFTDF